MKRRGPVCEVQMMYGSKTQINQEFRQSNFKNNDTRHQLERKKNAMLSDVLIK